ncbi:MAG: dihydrofolate reductase [Hyphomicrobiaceae bacterium]|nr:dihydrofolate reductase [Hyphomicrobiaceae bacterium]
MTDHSATEPEPILVLVVAAAENGVIGRGGRLPWRIPSDLRLFRRLTMGKPVIMGRRTFESIGKPLDGRDNIVMTRDPAFRAAGVIVEPSLAAAIAQARRLADARGVEEIMVIGGAEVFREALPQAERIYLTRVHGAPVGDTFLPPIPADEWREVSREPLPRGHADEHTCTLVVLERARKLA